MGKFDMIVCSPFLRCLQTAAKFSKQLELMGVALHDNRVIVCKDLGEAWANVAREMEGTNDKFNWLGVDDMQYHLGKGNLDIGDICGDHEPKWNEGREEAYFRPNMAMDQIRHRYPDKNILYIGHAKTLHSAGWRFNMMYSEIGYCGSMTVDRSGFGCLKFKPEDQVVHTQDVVHTGSFSEQNQYDEQFSIRTAYQEQIKNELVAGRTRRAEERADLKDQIDFLRQSVQLHQALRTAEADTKAAEPKPVEEPAAEETPAEEPDAGKC